MALGRGSLVSIGVGALVFVAALLLLRGVGADGSSADPVRPSNIRIVHLGGSPSAIAWSNGALWATAGDRLTRIDPDSMKLTRSGRLAALCDDSQFTFGLGFVWVTSGHCGPGRLMRIEPDTMAVTQIATAPGHLEGVAVWHRRVWVTAPNGASLLELDPRAGRLVPAALEVSGLSQIGLFAFRLNSLLATPDQLWGVVGGRGSGLLRITEAGGHLEGAPLGGDRPLVTTPLAFTGSVVWSAFGAAVAPLSARSGIQIGKPVRPPAGDPVAIAGGDTEVWIATGRRLYRGSIRPPVLVPSSVLPFRTKALAVGGGYIWAASGGDAIARMGDPPVVS